MDSVIARSLESAAFRASIRKRKVVDVDPALVVDSFRPL